MLKALSNVNEGNIEIKIIAVDKWGKKIEYSKSFVYRKSNEEKVLEIFSKYFGLTEAKKIVGENSWLISVYENYPRLIEKIAPYADNKLALLVLDQIVRDKRVGNKTAVLSKALDLISGVENYSRTFVYVPGNYSNALINGYPYAGSVKALASFNESLDPAVIVDFYGNKRLLYDVEPWKAYWLLVACVNKNQSLLNECHEEVAGWIIADTKQLLDVLGLEPGKVLELAYRHWLVMPRIGWELKRNIGDKNVRKAILVIQYTVPLRAWDNEHKKEISGLEAYLYHITETPKVAKQILKDWKENKLIKHYPTGDLIDPRSWWYARVDDWGYQGAKGSQIQLTGFGYQPFDGWNDPRAKNPDSYALKFDSPNSYLVRNWKKWDLYRYAEGYTLEVIKGPP